MNMPGFTAETSLYNTNKRYHLAVQWTNSANRSVITPQISPWVALITVYCRLICFPSPYSPYYRRCFWWCG